MPPLRPALGSKPNQPDRFRMKRTLQVAVVDVAVGGKPIVHVSAEIRLRGAAFGQPLMKRLISSKKRLEAGSCSRNKWFRPGKAMKRA